MKETPSNEPPARAPGPEPRRAPPSERATRVALVGTGFIADIHLEALREVEGIEVVALCDVVLERARTAARRHAVPHAVREPAELVQHSVDVVHLCVPPDLHVELARECLELGLSVFVEKPLALDGASADELFELARARGLTLGANHNSTFHPSFRRLLRRLQAGAIGKLEHVDVHLAVPLRQLDARDYSHWMFREPRNIIFEQAVHPFAQLAQLIGAPVEVHPVVLSTRQLRAGQDFHDRWAIAARAERGTAQLHFSFGCTFQQSTLRVRGSDGMLEVDLHRDLLQEERKTPWLEFWDTYVAGARRGTDLGRAARRNLYAYLRQTLRMSPRGDAFYAGMRASISAFHGAFRAGQEPPGDASEARTVLAWCENSVRGLRLQRRAKALSFEPREPRQGEIVVLGASGFIGRHTLRALLARELPVSAALRRPGNLNEDLEEAAREGRLPLVRADLGERASLAEAVRGARVVIHLATGGGTSWEEIQRAMVDGSRMLAEVCSDAGVERLVYVSSIAALYLGPDCGSEIVDDSDPLDPRPALRPLYARGKIAAEKALMKTARERGLALTIVRPGVVMGSDAPFQHSGIGLWVRDNHCVGWGPGNRPLPLVLVEDVADALARVAAFRGKELDGRALNLASSVPLSASELVAHYTRYSGRDVRFHARPLALSQTMEIGKWLVKKAGGRSDAFPSYRDLKSRSLWPRFSCAGARELLGWRPIETSEEFLRRLFPDPNTP